MNTVLLTVTALDILEIILIVVIFGIMNKYDIKEKITKGMAFAIAGVALVYWIFWL